MKQCAICSGEHDYEAEIPVHNEDGSFSIEDRQICTNCLARFLVCLAVDIADIRDRPVLAGGGSQ